MRRLASVVGWFLLGVLLGFGLTQPLILGEFLGTRIGDRPGTLVVIALLAGVSYLLGRTLARDLARSGAARLALCLGACVYPAAMAAQGLWVAAFELIVTTAAVLVAGHLGQRAVAHVSSSLKCNTSTVDAPVYQACT